MTLGLVDSFFFWIKWCQQFQRIIQTHIVGIQNQTEMEAFLLVAHLILHDIHFHTGAVASQGCNSSTSKANKYRFNGFNTSWCHSALFVWGFFFFHFLTSWLFSWGFHKGDYCMTCEPTTTNTKEPKKHYCRWSNLFQKGGIFRAHQLMLGELSWWLRWPPFRSNQSRNGWFSEPAMSVHQKVFSSFHPITMCVSFFALDLCALVYLRDFYQ